MARLQHEAARITEGKRDGGEERRREEGREEGDARLNYKGKETRRKENKAGEKGTEERIEGRKQGGRGK